MERSLQEIRSHIEAIENDETLLGEENVVDRAQAIDRLEFLVLARIEHLLRTGGSSKGLAGLERRAQQVRESLEEVNERIARELRERIRSRDYSRGRLKERFSQFVDRSLQGAPDDVGYGSLDALVSGLLRVGAEPEETRVREPEMVFYQPTPARIVLEFIEKAHIQEQDVFFDLGSGLGRVPILVNLLCGARARGIEFEPAYCTYARQCAKELNLSGVEFVNADAREANYLDGTVFFLYTPFEGKILEDVLARLDGESRQRTIRLGTYGPCTLQVSQQDWLRRTDRGPPAAYRLAVFESI